MTRKEFSLTLYGPTVERLEALVARAPAQPKDPWFPYRDLARIAMAALEEGLAILEAEAARGAKR